jgi:hypothetical protein
MGSCSSKDSSSAAKTADQNQQLQGTLSQSKEGSVIIKAEEDRSKRVSSATVENDCTGKSYIIFRYNDDEMSCLYITCSSTVVSLYFLFLFLFIVHYIRSTVSTSMFLC